MTYNWLISFPFEELRARKKKKKKKDQDECHFFISFFILWCIKTVNQRDNYKTIKLINIIIIKKL